VSRPVSTPVRHPASSPRPAHGATPTLVAAIPSPALAAPARTAPAATAPPQAFAFLSVNVDPSIVWAQVYVDGKLVKSETPLVMAPLAPGPHDVMVVRDGKKATRRLVLKAGDRETVLFDSLH